MADKKGAWNQTNNRKAVPGANAEHHGLIGKKTGVVYKVPASKMKPQTKLQSAMFVASSPFKFLAGEFEWQKKFT